MRQWIIPIILTTLLVSCGRTPAISDPTAAAVTSVVADPTAAPVPTVTPVVADPTAAPVPTAEAFPTGAPEPTLTRDQITQVALMDSRASSMIEAAQDLQKLGQEIRATAAWKGKVQVAAALITAGQHAIQGAALSDYYSPLNDRAKAVTDECAAIVQKLPDVDKLTVAAVADSEPTLQVCIRKLKLLQVSLSGL